MIIKHNNNMKKWVRNSLVIIIGALIINALFHHQLQATRGQTETITKPDTSNYTTKEYQDFVNCSKKVLADTPTASQQEVEQKCRGKIPTNCNLEGAWGWIMCPALFMVGEGTDASYNFIQGMLKIDVKFFDTNSENSAFKPWQQVRNIANVGLIIFFMWVIISQVTGYGIGNYGIKKILPRIIMAAILINVSYVISQFLIDLSNLIGTSVLKLFQGFENTVFLRSPNDAGTVVGLGASGAMMIIMGIMTVKQVSIMTSLFALIVPLLVSFIMVVIITGLILLIRQAASIVLVIISPIAFLSLIFPNTEQMFKFWKKSMGGILIVFPVIGMLFGAAGFISKLLVSSSDTFLMQTLGFVISGMPLIFTPSIVKSTLAAIPMIGTTFGNAFNKLQSGATNATRNSRSVQLAKKTHQQRFEQIKSGNASGAKGVLGLQEKATAAIFGSYNRRTRAGRAQLHDIENRRTDSISNMASRISDQDLGDIMEAAKNGSLSKLDFGSLSQDTQRAMIANGFNQNNTAELAAAAMLKRAQSGDLSSDEFSGVMDYALQNNLTPSSAHRIAEEARKSSNAKGRFDTAGYIRGLQKQAGGINQQNLSNFKNNINNIAHQAIANQLNSMGADEIAKINKKSLDQKLSPDGFQVFQDTYRNSPQFSYITDASLKDPTMSAETYNAIMQAK